MSDPQTPTSPGARLRAERERLNLDIGHVAAELHVSASVIAALESDDYATLGAPIFVRGHLRNYARLLKLPVEELIETYERQSTLRPPELVVHRSDGPAVAPRTNPTALAWASAGIIAVMLVLFGVWLYNQPFFPRAREESDQVAQTETVVVAPAASQGLLPAEALDQPATPSLPAATPLASTSPASATSSPATAGGTAAAPKSAGAGTETPAESPAPDGRVAVVMRFSGESWVEVYDADGKPLFYNLGQTGETHALEGRAPLRFFLGNAPAVNVIVDGHRFDPAPYTRRDNTARFSVEESGH
ncbi:MAG TPA: RodZ domain-containing protein [Gammaproteobacteria bacterium]|nr:RodZ domain-containing protein [Gammaproteobacteria bacterium]